jgi:hypothetical protein
MYNSVRHSIEVSHVIGGISERQIVETEHISPFALPLVSLPTPHEATMADSVAEQIKAHIHEILRLVHDSKGRTLRELNKLVEQTGKLVGQPTTKVHAEIKRLKTTMSE